MTEKPVDRDREYTVQAGDTLTLIALKHYGPGSHDKWRRVFDANRAVIGDNPYLLRPGMVLRIPALPGPPDPAA